MLPLVTAYQRIMLAGTAPDWWAFRWHAAVIALLLALALLAFTRLSGEIIDEL